MAQIGEETLKTMKLVSWYNNWLLQTIKPYLGKTILEIGAGIGNFTFDLAKYGKVWAIDIDSDYIHALKKKENAQVKVGFGDIEKGNYFFKSCQFDSIVCLNVLEHIENDKEALKNMHFLLKPGGKLILLVPAHESLYSNFDKELGHYRRYTTQSAKQKLLEAGFSSSNVRYLNWVAAAGWFWFMKVLRKKRIPENEVKTFDFLGKFLLLPEKFITLPFGLSVLAIGEK
jgi:SAM-dependent methyltransferase